MQRLKLKWAAALCVLGVGLVGGAWVYHDHQQVQHLGLRVYKEFDHDGLPLPAGVLDDPVFAGLPQKSGPVSFGRYKPPKSQTTPALPAPGRPLPSVQLGTSSGGQTQKPQPLPQPEAVVPGQTVTAGQNRGQSPAPQTFTERLATPQTLHLLLIGNDQEQLDRGRADVLMVVTLDSVNRQMSLLSVPRDTRIDLPGRGIVKINAAYAYGGAGLQTAAVERFLGIPMDKIVEISLGGFQQAIDAVGGVQVNPSFAFSLDGQSFVPGAQKLSGVQALAYSRMRHDDPQGDLGRNTRQQEVIRSLIGALGQLPTQKLIGVLDTLQDTLRTNFSPSEVVRMRTERPYILDHQTRVSVRGSNQKIGGIWYYVVSDQERQRLHLLLR